MAKYFVYFEPMLVTARNEEQAQEKAEERICNGEIPQIDYIEEE
jgi:hypothetical protein